MFAGSKTLEINPNHPVIRDLLERVKANTEDDQAEETATVLFQAALLDSGFDITDPSVLVQKMYRLMSTQLGVDPDAPVEEVHVPVEEEEQKKEDEKKEEDYMDFEERDSNEFEEEEEGSLDKDEL